MMIIFEMEQLWCLVNTFPNFGQRLLTKYWLKPLSRSKLIKKWLKRKLLTKWLGVFVGRWVRHPIMGSKWAHGMYFDLQKILYPYLPWFGKYPNSTFDQNRVFYAIFSYFTCQGKYIFFWPFFLTQCNFWSKRSMRSPDSAFESWCDVLS